MGSGRRKCSGKPVSRILSSSGTAWAIISLGWVLPHNSCNLPGSSTLSVRKRAAFCAMHLDPAWSCSWRGLPGQYITALPVVSYTTFSPLPVVSEEITGGMFLWPCPTGFPIPGVTRRHALWSADFPRHPNGVPRSPGLPEHCNHTPSVDNRQIIKKQEL